MIIIRTWLMMDYPHYPVVLVMASRVYVNETNWKLHSRLLRKGSCEGGCGFDLTHELVPIIGYYWVRWGRLLRHISI